MDDHNLTNDDAPLLKGWRALQPDEIAFEDEIIIEKSGLLNFYVPIYFDVDAVFGPGLIQDDSDDYINVHASYDLKKGCVCDNLDVILVYADGGEKQYGYLLSNEEKAIFEREMDAYCMKDLGQPLPDFRREYLAGRSILERLAQAKEKVQGAPPSAKGAFQPDISEDRAW